MTTPCSKDPDLFFGGHTEYVGQTRGGPSLAMKDRAKHQSDLARTQCLRHCPLAQQRACAQLALDSGAAYGVWAGVQLPGGQTRKIPALNAKREILAGIASGSIDPLTHSSNADILANDAVTLLAPRNPRTLPLFPLIATAVIHASA